jgi:tetratricopeptide (TPR) repeat protein
MQGEYQFNLRTPESLKNAEQLFEAAAAKDPSFANAYLGIARVEISSISMTTTTTEQTIPHMRWAVQKAIELDPNLGEAHALLGYIDYEWRWDWGAAETEFRRALALGTNAEASGQYGWSLTTRGRFSEAHAQLHLSAELDPLAILPHFDEFFTYNFERNVSGEKKAIQEVLRLRPNFFGGHALSVVADVQEHDRRAAQNEANWIAKTYPTLPAAQSVLAFAAACAGEKAEAIRLLGKMEALHAPAYQVAITYALLHDADNTMAQLTKSADAHEGQILYLKYDPFFDEIRSDPRYVALEKRVGLI